MSNIVYVGTYFDTLGRELPNDKKIGITTDNVHNRQRALSRTKSPLGFVMLYAWKVDMEARLIEKTLHDLFKDQRITGEWFRDEGETVADGVFSLMNLLSTVGTRVEQMDLETREVAVEGEPSVEISTANLVRKRKSKSSITDEFCFTHLNGATFVQNAYKRTIVVEVLSDRFVAYYEDDKDKSMVEGNRKETYSHLVVKAHKDTGATSQCAPNFGKIKDASGEELYSVVEKLKSNV